MTTVYTAELQQEKKAIVKAFPHQSQALAWARERISDETVSAVTVWENKATGTAHAALVIAAEGKPWHDERRIVAVITRQGTRVSRTK